MKEEDALKTRYGNITGQRVPDNYFSQLEKQIMEQLPPYKKGSPVIELSRWQRVKPYVYLAAMFCGIWLMMKVFHSVTEPMSMSLDNPPAAIVELFDNGYDYDFEPYSISYSPEYDLEDEEFIMSYDSIEDFEKDFGYTLKPEYSTVSRPTTKTNNG